MTNANTYQKKILTIPHTISLIMVGACIGIMLMSFILYTMQNVKAIKNKTFDT